MKTASISELKARLSEYIREVRRGGEIQVLDRGVPVARLTRPAAGAVGRSDALRRLIADGAVRAGTGKTSSILDVPPLKLPASLSEALRAERRDRV